MFAGLLENKKILLGVSGSISIYKSLELIRLFIKSGAQVRVIMSESAKKFITPLTFETISMNTVLHEDTESWDNDLNHIKIGEWADAFVIAPASANTMAKLSQGFADNLLLQTALAYPGEKLLCPAANTHMINNPLIATSMQNLAKSNYTLMRTQTKLLACNTQGDGALIDIEEIYFKTAQMLLKEDFWSNRPVSVSAGGTIEKIDDVRYISNFSSGKMGSSLALALYLKGADVTFVSTRFPLRLPADMKQTQVQSSQQMYQALSKSLEDTGTKEAYLFMVAAVSDYIPNQTQAGKLKKAALGEQWHLELTQNMDILHSIDKSNLKAIGFKAEMDKHTAMENASKMLDKKGLDAVCLNLLEDSSSFATDDNAIEFITSKETVSLNTQDKLSLSFEILRLCKSL